MPIDRMPPNEEQVERWFGKAPDVPDGTFEFALVLGGTVSAGAYTAGAMDFLVEALDCLYDARAAGGPTHSCRNGRRKSEFARQVTSISARKRCIGPAHSFHNPKVIFGV